VLKRDGKALIDMVDGLSLGSVVLVDVTNDDLADHDARLGDETIEHLSGHDNHAQAIAATFLVVVGVLLDGNGLGGDQTLSCLELFDFELFFKTCSKQFSNFTISKKLESMIISKIRYPRNIRCKFLC
jgi:hypothetical protein